MATLKRWNGSSWVTVPDGTAFKYWNGSAWVNPSHVKYWDGNSWEICWNKSDPQTLTADADFTTAVRYNGSSYVYDPVGEASDDGETYPRFGAYRGTNSYHYISLLGFPMTSIISAMNTRPNITAARLRMTRISGVGWGTTPGGTTVRVGSWTQSNWRSLPSISNPASYDDWSPLVNADIGNWGTGNLWVDIDPQHAQDLVNGRALLLSEIGSGYNTALGNFGDWTDAYTKIGGIVGGTVPRLEVTIDY